MLAKRIVPCLDIKDGQTVKGIQFEQLRHAGDPVELAASYASQGADELVFLDITATHEGRTTFVELVHRIAQVLDIPFTVGGGISSVQQVEALLRAGADKVSINSAAVRNPELISDLAREFGSQCVVVAIDINIEPQPLAPTSGPKPTSTFSRLRRDQTSNLAWRVFLNGGRIATERWALDWAIEAADRGAGEILLTSMAHDGMKTGFALDITRQISEAVPIPVIASGGAGQMEHFMEVFTEGKADAALAASIFHFGEIQIPDLKKYLNQHGIPIRFDA